MLFSLYRTETTLQIVHVVIHNGQRPLHGAVECIEMMLDRGKRMAILSNTSSPSSVALGRLKKYGLRPDMFAGGLVSSGEECARFVRENYSCGSTVAPKKALWITWKESESQSPFQFLSHCEGAGGAIGVAESVEDADFVLLHGSEVWRRRRELSSALDDSGGDCNEDDWVDLNFMYNEEYTIIDKLLEESAQRKLPMVCANPDLIVGLPGGVVGNMPGKIAQRYERRGGAVHHFGKPNPRHYHACLENLGIDFGEGSKRAIGVAHVGDSLEHDVVGANRAGIDSIFVLGGIHAKELGLVPTAEGVGIAITDDGSAGITKKELEGRLESFFKQKGIFPTHVVPSLSLDQ